MLFAVLLPAISSVFSLYYNTYPMEYIEDKILF